MARFIAGQNRERGVCHAMDFEADGTLKTRLVARKGLAQLAVQFGIARLPHLVPNMDSLKIQIALAKAEQLRLGPPGFVHGIDAPSLLLLVRVARVEDHPIARLKRCHQPDGHLLALDATDFAQVNSPLLAKASMGQFLVVHPSEPSRVKPPRESHFQSIPRLRPDLLHG